MELAGYVYILGISVYQIIIEILLFTYLFINPMILKTIIVFFLCGLPAYIVLYFLFANKKHTVPGAIDDLTGVAVTSCIAKVLKDWKDNNPELYPKNTEVQVVLTGCEENGCRGAEQFAIKHAEEYNKIDTTAIALESFTESRYQTIFNKEGLINMPPEIIDALAECCNDLGYEYKVIPCPPVGGGTDSRGFMKYGLRSACLMGMDFKWAQHWYHTDRDNLDLINKERRPLEDGGTSWKDFNVRGSMEMALKTCLKYIEIKDKE
jgi:Zn-dependent M28 family amino/carboxypeptidase